MVGRPMTLLDPPQRTDGETRSVGQIGYGAFIEQSETMGRRADGTLIDIALTISPIKNDQNKVIGISNIARDITDRKRASEELEQRVLDRTQELIQAHEREKNLATELNLTEQRERKRLATEMHDYLAQLLVLAKMKLDQGKLQSQTADKRDALIEIQMKSFRRARPGSEWHRAFFYASCGEGDGRGRDLGPSAPETIGRVYPWIGSQPIGAEDRRSPRDRGIGECIQVSFENWSLEEGGRSAIVDVGLVSG